MSRGEDIPESGAGPRCNWLALIAFGVMILYGGAFFFHPAIGPPVLTDAKQFGWQSPLLILLCAGLFTAFFWYVIWCNGLMPFRVHPLRRSTSVCARFGMYVAAFALSGWLSAILTWGVGLIVGRHLVLGTALLAAGVAMALVIWFMLRALRSAMDKQIIRHGDTG